MQVYFYKATYTQNNVYKLSDFFVADNFILNPNKMLDLNITPHDGNFTYITKQLTLPDSTSIRDHTHIYIPDYKKVYKIVRIMYLNKSQWSIMLEEDVLIANYQTLRTKDFYLKRTNDGAGSRFRGLLDTSSIGYTYTSEFIPVHKPTHTGKWLLYFIKHKGWTHLNPGGYSPIKLRLNVDSDAVFNIDKASIFDSLDNIFSLLIKYPEHVTTTPEKYQYFNKRVSINNGIDIYQCMYFGGQLRWKKIKISVDLSGPIESNTELELRINSDDMSKKFPEDFYSVLAFPYETNIASGTTYVQGTQTFQDTLVSAESLNQIVLDSNTEIIDTKLVDESLLFDTTTSITEQGTFDRTEVSFNKKYLTATKTNNYNTYKVLRANGDVAEYNNGDPTIKRFAVLVITGFNTQINASLNKSLTIPMSYEPFTNYELNIYGNKVSIPALYVNSTYISFSVGIGAINYSIYADTAMERLIGSGSFTLQTKYSVDQLDAFYQQNPTYKEQFTASMFQKLLGVGAGVGASTYSAYSQQALATKQWSNQIEAGLAALENNAAGMSSQAFSKEAFGLDRMITAGAPSGAAGALAAGAIGFAVKNAVDTGFSVYQNHLMLEGLSKKPDQILGDGSNALFNMNNRYGIFWQIKTSNGGDAMAREYYFRGFPTSDITNINSLTAQPNTVYGTCKYIQGRMISTLGNAYITDEIDRKLQEGVVII